MTKYGALKHTTYNIGDEIQSIASWRFYPQVDYYVYREHLDKFCPDGVENFGVKMILNSWYMHNPHNFPPSKYIDPLLISMCLSKEIRDDFLTDKTISYLKEYGPVGCRDYPSLRFLEENHIPAYFSGCLTTTLVENPELKKRAANNKYILCAYCTQDIVDAVKKRTNLPVYYISKNYTPTIDSMDRFELAKAVLYMYHNAHCVITPNLHTALPCLAFNVPVCVLDPGEYIGDDDRKGRFEGLVTLTNHYKKEEFIKNNVYDINNPPENPKDYIKMREDLVKRCKDFTGFDSNLPTLPDDFDPTPKLIEIMSHKTAKYRRALYFASEEELFYMWQNKVKNKVERYSIDDNTNFEFNLDDFKE